MGREVRKVAAGWVHPKGESLYGGSFSKRDADWAMWNDLWQKGYREQDCNGTVVPKEAEHVGMSFEQWAGARPVKEQFMPDWPPEQRTHFAYYENVSEGSALSPTCATLEQLATWCFEYRKKEWPEADCDMWLKFLKGCAQEAE